MKNMDNFKQKSNVDLWKKTLELAKQHINKEKEETSKNVPVINSHSRRLNSKTSGFDFFSEPTKEFIIDNCGCSDNSIDEIFYIYLTHYQFTSVGALQHCRFLTICILNNNNLSHFYGLINCQHLLRLDLHSNQIFDLPDEGFWLELKKLQLLNLHDNLIDNIKSVCALNKCSSLIALTIFDNCFGEQQHYRESIVTMLWFLKALDHYVIADEEIIDGLASFERFKPLSTSLIVDLCPENCKSVKVPLYEKEKNNLKNIVSSIHHKLSHFSPLVIIQRWIRGHLCRKKLKRSYADIKSKTLEISQSDFSLPPESVKVKDVPTQEFSLDNFICDLPEGLMLDFQKLQMDIYHAYRSKASATVLFHVLNNSSLLSKPAVWKSLRTNTKKDAARRFSCLLSETFHTAEANLLRRRIKESSVKSCLALLQRRFERLDSDRNARSSLCSFDSWISNHSWRIHDKNINVSVEKAKIKEADAFTLHVKACRAVGKDLREALEEWRNKMRLQVPPKAVKWRPPLKLFDTFRLDMLTSITELYKRREALFKAEAKLARVAEVEQEKRRGRFATSEFLTKKRDSALNRREPDRRMIITSNMKLRADHAARTKEINERRISTLVRQRSVEETRELAASFCRSVGCLSNALVSHDKTKAYSKIFDQKKKITAQVKTDRLRGEVKLHVHANRKRTVNMLQRKQDAELAYELIAKDAREKFDDILALATRVRIEKAIGRQLLPLHLPVATNLRSTKRPLVNSVNSIHFSPTSNVSPLRNPLDSYSSAISTFPSINRELSSAEVFETCSSGNI